MADTSTIDSLREQHEQLSLKAEIANLEQALRAADLEAHRLIESEWGDIVDRREYLYDTPGFGYARADGRISRPDDRKDGKFYPFFENEMDLANIRGIGRYLATATDTGVAVIENLTNYTIGTGFTYQVQPRDPDPKANRGLVGAVQACVDAFTGQLAEREVFGRSRTDGEYFAWIHEFQGEPVLDVVEPEFVTQPRDIRTLEDYIGDYGLSWSFGVASLPNRPARVAGYFSQWYGSASDWEFIPPQEMIHLNLNTPTGVKRGLSDFYAVYLTLERAGKLLGNTLQGSAIQATIAYIKEHAPGATAASIQSIANSKADQILTVNKPGGGTKQVRQRKFEPGTIIETGANTKYHAGPLGSVNGPQFVNIVQAAFRVAGARWAMPEYMISGDASNGNYASILTAGGPFDRATQARQGFYKTPFERAHWMALGIRCRRGQFARFGIYTLDQLQAAVKINVTAPTVAVQDSEKEESIRERRKKAGVLSARTWADQVGLDYDAEVKNGAKEDATDVLPATKALESTQPTTSWLDKAFRTALGE